MNKKLVNLLGLSMIGIMSFLGTNFANTVKNIGTANLTQMAEEDFDVKSSTLYEIIDYDRNKIVSRNGELGTRGLYSSGWDYTLFRSSEQRIRIYAVNNSEQKVYCKITKGDGSYLGGGSKFSLKPGKSNTFTGSFGPGEYKFYVENSDGSPLDVMVSARELP